MDPPGKFQKEKPGASEGGQFEVLQHCSSTTDSTVTGGGGDSVLETPIGTAESSSTSVHAVFNLCTGKVMDAIKETRELLDGGKVEASKSHNESNKKTKRNNQF